LQPLPRLPPFAPTPFAAFPGFAVSPASADSTASTDFAEYAISTTVAASTPFAGLTPLQLLQLPSPAFLPRNREESSTLKSKCLQGSPTSTFDRVFRFPSSPFSEHGLRFSFFCSSFHPNKGEWRISFQKNLANLFSLASKSVRREEKVFKVYSRY
jgi:hypothetical protein